MRNGFAITSLLVALMLCPRATSAQEIAAGGAIVFLTQHGESHKIGDVFGEVSWSYPIGASQRWLQASALAGYGDEGDGMLGVGLRHFWQAAEGIYPGLGAQVFYLNGGGLDGLQETSVFIGPEASLELLSESFDVKVMPFLAWYPAILGEDANILRFGLRLNEYAASDNQEP
jgi:hypothetical protein